MRTQNSNSSTFQRNLKKKKWAALWSLTSCPPCTLTVYLCILCVTDWLASCRRRNLNSYRRCRKPLRSTLARAARPFHGTAGTDVFFLAVSISSQRKAISTPPSCLPHPYPSLRWPVISQHSGLEEESQRLKRANPETICKQRHGSTQSASSVFFFFFCFYSFSHARL